MIRSGFKFVFSLQGRDYLWETKNLSDGYWMCQTVQGEYNNRLFEHQNQISAMFPIKTLERIVKTLEIARSIKDVNLNRGYSRKVERIREYPIFDN